MGRGGIDFESFGKVFERRRRVLGKKGKGRKRGKWKGKGKTNGAKGEKGNPNFERDDFLSEKWGKILWHLGRIKKMMGEGRKKEGK